MTGETEAIGGESECFSAGQIPNAPGNLDNIGSKQGLPTREAKLPKTEICRDGDNSDELIGREVVGLLRPAFVALRHAVKAPLVAAIRHRDTQVIDGPSEGIHGYELSISFPAAITKMLAEVERGGISGLNSARGCFHRNRADLHFSGP